MKPKAVPVAIGSRNLSINSDIHFLPSRNVLFQAMSFYIRAESFNCKLLERIIVFSTHINYHAFTVLLVQLADYKGDSNVILF